MDIELFERFITKIKKITDQHLRQSRYREFIGISEELIQSANDDLNKFGWDPERKLLVDQLVQIRGLLIRRMVSDAILCVDPLDNGPPKPDSE